MILVAGATGFLGREICRRLVERGHAVRGLVRTTSEPPVVAALREMGVETVVGDVKERASLDAACRGARTVISTITATRVRQQGDGLEATDRDGQLALVNAAREAGVAHFIYISVAGYLGADDTLMSAKREVELRIRDSGMIYTILRPANFMEVWLGPHLGFDFANARATIYGSGERPVSWISSEDVAAFAVRSVDDPAAENAVIELGGPEALTPLEVVRIFEAVGGRPFQLQHVPETALEAQRAAAPDSLSRTFATLMLALSRGGAIPMEETVRRFPLPLHSVRDYARRVMKGRGTRGEGRAGVEDRESTADPHL